MRKLFGAFAVLALALTIVAGAAAGHKTPAPQWYSHLNGAGKIVCDQGNNGITGPFVSKQSCEDSLIPTIPTPEGPADPTVGWPSTGGTASGDYTCSPITLTSTDDDNGYGAIDFTGPFGTFAQLPIFNSSDYAILSGTGAQSEPYLIVRFSDHTQAFVYATDVTGPGTRYSDLAGNSYLTRAQALAAYGDKQVSSVTLAVDNGDLSIGVIGVALSNCTPVTPPVVTPPVVTAPILPSELVLCYSKFGVETNPAVFTREYALWLWNNQPLTGTWFLPVAIAGNGPDWDNIGDYHLVCNPAATKKDSGAGVGGSGEVYDAVTTALYDAQYVPDFQVWHIYK